MHMPSLLLTSVNAGTSASAVVIRFCSYSAVSHWVSDVSLLLFHCRAYNMTSTLRGSRSLTAATQPSAPGQPSKFQFQIINLPDPHDPVLDQFQAEVLGEFGSSLTPTQIVALRCYHPVLRQYNKVYFSTVGESHYIVVSAVSLNRDIVNVLPLPLMIGGYQIHFFPDEIFTPSDRVIYSQVDLINITIDPHRPLEPSVTSLLKHYFTLSIGARLLVFGHLVVLFPDIKSLQWTKSHTLSMPLTIGKLTYSFDVLSIAPSSHSATSNPLHSKPHACQSISTHPASESEQSSAIDLPIYSRAAPINLNDRCNMIDPDISSSALLGVKVHIPERDIIAWTSPTHAWVPTKGRKRSWKMPLMEVVRRLRFWKMCGRGKAVGQSNEDEANPLGKIIYYEGTREVIGTVGHIYDSPSARLPYPQGYRHDLALIVGPKLPTFSQPTNCAKLLTKFATPEEALKAGTVFLLKSESDFRRSKPGTLDIVSGHVASTARDALIMGVQSTWGYTSHLEITNSLIWRSDPDDKDVGGASGSLLCLGSNADKVVKGLVFQNFEGRYPGQSWQRDDKGVVSYQSRPRSGRSCTKVGHARGQCLMSHPFDNNLY